MLFQTWSEPDLIIADRAELVSGLLKGRGLKDVEEQARYLQPNYASHLADPFLMSGIDTAVQRILLAIKNQEKVVVYGDYDIDGLTASSLLYSFLKPHLPNVEVYIPDRFEEGYGLHKEALLGLAKEGTQLVITVDCGITAVDELAAAAKAGLDVIVTDHHSLPAKLPTKVVALINPLLSDSKYPARHLAGVGVAFTLARALQARDPERWQVGQEKWLLDLVALGTVCDVVELTGENRVLVHYGLKVLACTRRVGLQALAEVSGVELTDVTAEDLGFRLGPRLNAAGRLEHAKKALQLLISEDLAEAEVIAQDLNLLNTQRQDLNRRVFDAADKAAGDYPNDIILVLSGRDWSHGIVGIVASKVSEKYQKPAIILEELGEVTKGSARSYGQVNIVEVIGSAADLLDKFGGHAFAAGVTLKTKNIDAFRKTINEYARKKYKQDDLLSPLQIDARLHQALLELGTVEQLQVLEPFGRGNAKPVFMSELMLKELRLIGKDLNHVKFRFEGGGKQVDGISFGTASRWRDLPIGKSFEVAYCVSENVWNDMHSLQLEVVDIREAA